MDNWNMSLIFHRSLAIKKKLDDKSGMGVILNNIGLVYRAKDDYDKALDYHRRSLAIREELGDKSGMGYTLNDIGMTHYDKGEQDSALRYFNRSFAIREELDEKVGMGVILSSIGIYHHDKGNYDRAKEYLEKSLAIHKEIELGGFWLLGTNTYLYSTYKHLGKDYDEKEIHSLIKEAENIEFELNLRLYELLENKSYLETAYNQIQEKVSVMDKDLGNNFLSYPIPKAIVEEYNKVFKK